MDGEIAQLRTAIDAVPWQALAHAYDLAVDAPHQLAAFFDARSADDQALRNAVDWMWSAVLHQGSVYSATVPCVDLLVGLLEADPEHPAGDQIAEFVDVVAESLSFVAPEERAADSSSDKLPVASGDAPLFEAWVSLDPAPVKKSGLKRLIPAKKDRSRYFAATYVRPGLLETMLSRSVPVLSKGLHSGRAETRSASLGTLCRIASHGSELADLVSVADLHGAIGGDEFDPGCWVSAALIGEGHVGELAQHPDRRVRLAAALHPNHPDEARALHELTSATHDLEWLEASFPNPPPTLSGHMRFHLLRRVLDLVPAQNAESDVIAGICGQLAKRSRMFSVESEWGLVVQWAFADRLVQLSIQDSDMEPPPEVFTDAQRAVLETLLALDDHWDPRLGSASRIFRSVQLPYDQKALRSLLS